MKSVLIVLLVSFSMLAFAQNAEAVLDTAKVDSFYKSLNIDLALAENPAVYYEVFRWYNTCYRYGGNSNVGIDCSHFVNVIYEKHYGKKLEGGSASIYPKCTPIKKLEDAKEGDLVFFTIRKGRISHVALYLQNGKFAHATTQLGVTISSIEEPYYKKYYYSAGRIE